MRSFVFSLRVLVCIVIFLAACNPGCKPKATEQEDASQATSVVDVNKEASEGDIDALEAQATEESADEIALTINGVDITETKVQEVLKPELDKLDKRPQKLPPAIAQTVKKQLRQQVLEKIIIEHLLDEKVKEANIVVTEEELAGEFTKVAAAQKPPLSLDEFKKKLAEYGQDFDAIKQQVKKGMAYQKVMEAQWAGKINITEEDARKQYDQNPEQFETAEQVRASHILIAPAEITDPNADPNQAKAEAKAKAQDLLEQVKNGADFAELAKANSACGSAVNGGDLDFFTRGRMAAPFEKAAFELKVGEVSDIVETQFGYHIIKVTDHKDAGTISFEQAKDNIIQQLIQEKKNELAQEYINSLKAEASIVYPPGKDPMALPMRG